MPTPVGHALGGVIVALAVGAGRAGRAGGNDADIRFTYPTHPTHQAHQPYQAYLPYCAFAACLPDIVGECRAAVAWLHAHADALGFDAGRIVLAGSSAGAYLAAACADASPTPIRGIVLVSGIYDVAPLIGTSINDALGLDASTAGALDLLHGAHRFCPAVVAWGEIETSEFRRQSRAFAARLIADGVACTSLEVPGRNHFDVVLDLADASTPLFDAARLTRH